MCRLPQVMVFLAEFFLCLNWAPVSAILLVTPTPRALGLSHCPTGPPPPPQYTIVPARRSTAEAVQILISHTFGDATSPTVIGAVSPTLFTVYPMWTLVPAGGPSAYWCPPLPIHTEVVGGGGGSVPTGGPPVPFAGLGTPVHTGGPPSTFCWFGNPSTYWGAPSTFCWFGNPSTYWWPFWGSLVPGGGGGGQEAIIAGYTCSSSSLYMSV